MAKKEVEVSKLSNIKKRKSQDISESPKQKVKIVESSQNSKGK